MDTKNKYLFSNSDIFALLIPLIVEQFLEVAVGMSDSIMVSSVGEAAVSAVSLVDNVMVLLINIFSALATGGAIIAGQYLGQKNNKRANEASSQLVWFITIISLVIMVVTYCGTNIILDGIFGHITLEVRSYAKTYLLIVAASIPFIAIYSAGAAIFRTMGNSKVSMKVSLIMNIINICGNAILIYGFKRGIEGVAIPTLISRMIAAITIIILLLDTKNVLYIEKTLHYSFDKNMIKNILKIGIPNGFENSMFQLGKIMVVSLVSTFGTSAIAANAVSNTITSFMILPGMAISLADTTIIARCIGANDFIQAKYYNGKLNIMAHISMLFVNLLVVLLLPYIFKTYNFSSQTEQTAKTIILMYAITVFILWPIAYILPTTFRAAGDVKFTTAISIISMWIFRIGCSYLLAQYYGLGVLGVWIAMIIDWVVRAICFVIRYLSGAWEKHTLQLK